MLERCLQNGTMCIVAGAMMVGCSPEIQVNLADNYYSREHPYQGYSGNVKVYSEGESCPAPVVPFATVSVNKADHARHCRYKKAVERAQ